VKIHPTNDTDYELWVLIGETREAMFRARRRELAPNKVTPRHAAVLAIIKDLSTDASPTTISKRLLRETHSTSEILSRMEKIGYVTRCQHPSGGGSVRIKLTRKGLRAYHESYKRSVIHRIIGELSATEREQLSSCLNKLLLASLREIGASEPPFPLSR
jgi:DNA-binding MarR family transcriptional regulator